MIRESIETLIEKLAPLKPLMAAGRVRQITVTAWGEMAIWVDDPTAFLTAFPEASTESHDDQLIQHHYKIEVKSGFSHWHVRVYALEDR